MNKVKKFLVVTLIVAMSGPVISQATGDGAKEFEAENPFSCSPHAGGLCYQ